ncbi:MAG: DUF3429 domain-containing protein [Hyphococcus sp.]
MAYDAFIAANPLRADESPVSPNVKTGVAQLLAYLAGAPLIAAALYIVGAGPRVAAVQFMGIYGAALIVFFGGVRWGVAVMRPEGPTFRNLLGAGLPLVAALPLFLLWAAEWKFLAIMALTGVLLIDDLNATRRGSGAPGWYLSVRLPLTVLIELAFLVALVGM